MAASSGAAVQVAVLGIGEQLLKAAQKLIGNPFDGARIEDISFAERLMHATQDPERSMSIADIMARSDLNVVEAEETAGPGILGMLAMTKKARNTHSAVFAEVKIDDELGVVRVTRIVMAVVAGRILNPKTARSQILGVVVMGIGMALHEETLMDHRFGRPMNHSFAEYHISVNADIPEIEVILVDEKDKEVSPLGVKGLGEIGIVGTSAAVANAVFHAGTEHLKRVALNRSHIRLP